MSWDNLQPTMYLLQGYAMSWMVFQLSTERLFDGIWRDSGYVSPCFVISF